MMRVESAYRTPWTTGQLLSFRFLFVFFTLHIFPFPLGHVPGLYVVTQWYTTVWHAIIPWVGTHVLKLDEPITVLILQR